MKFRSNETDNLNHCITLEFDKHLSSTATETHFTSQSDWTTLSASVARCYDRTTHTILQRTSRGGVQLPWLSNPRENLHTVDSDILVLAHTISADVWVFLFPSGSLRGVALLRGIVASISCLYYAFRLRLLHSITMIIKYLMVFFKVL